ncbi:MAG: VanW family protein, partial [Coriobacteriaceae bacterium]|nr:VanW family protein [Coriobacteriaceae bacterium]
YATARNHNIHLAADILNNSIIVRDGGTWSFHERAGNCNEDAGFQGAGAIVEGEIVDNDIGGGICQVATTVFNAVYEAGYPVLQRHNHSIYVAGYPDGRDAAVNWPDLDFRWKNNTTSDTLLTMSYTDSTLTAALYGVSPEYVVTTNVGEWSEGDKFKKRMVEDEELPEGYSYIKTEGVDGSNITVVRTVSDKSGNILYQDNFISNYEAVDQIRLAGPNTPDPDKASSASSNN